MSADFTSQQVWWEWRPIETAPKDGSYVLVAFRHSIEPRDEWMMVVKWTDNGGGGNYFNWQPTMDGSPANSKMAVAWMPLPPPPTDK